jgi:hypothetical protein
MISTRCFRATVKRAALCAAVAGIAGVSAPTALALNPQPLPPGRSVVPTHSLPPDPCSVAASGRC